MSIVRGPRPQGNFYILDKKISEDQRLSWAARGLLIFLLGKPDHWRVNVQALVNETQASPRPTGRDGTWSLLRELIESGYCARTQTRKPDGTLAEMTYTISEEAGPSDPEEAAPAPHTDQPHTAQPGTASPGTANPTLVSIEGKQGLKGIEQGLSPAAPSAPPPPAGKPPAKPPSPKKPTAGYVETYPLPDWIDRDHWNVWRDQSAHRKATDAQKRLVVAKLEKWRAAGIDAALALENSATNGWQGLFQPDHNQPIARQTQRAATSAGLTDTGENHDPYSHPDFDQFPGHDANFIDVESRVVE